MKTPRGPFAAMLLIFLVGAMSSCATHPCGVAHGPVSRQDFVFREFQGKDHVYPLAMTRSPGAPILILHGLGGLDGAALEWGKALGEHGWKVYFPMLDGEFDKCDPVAHAIRMRKSGIWKTDDLNASGQVLDDMGALADEISTRHGGQRVVVVGNCLTGSFPLALLARRSVKTAVLCQPALPLKSPVEALLGLSQSPEKRKALAIPPDQMAASLRALHDPSKRLYGFHYFDDPLASIDKFVWLHEQLKQQGIGSKFRPVVLLPAGSKSAQNWWISMSTTVRKETITPHVTLTGAEEPDRANLRREFDRMIQP